MSEFKLEDHDILSHIICHIFVTCVSWLKWKSVARACNRPGLSL